MEGDAAQLLDLAKNALANVSPEEMLEQAKIGVLEQLRRNPPPSYFAGMQRQGYTERQAADLWDFIYAQGAYVEVDLARVLAGK